MIAITVGSDGKRERQIVRNVEFGANVGGQ